MNAQCTQLRIEIYAQLWYDFRKGGMNLESTVLEYKCPCCGAALTFSEDNQTLNCHSCGNELETDSIRALHEEPREESFSWDDVSAQNLSDTERDTLQSFTCSSCGGELMTDGATVATFCPYCDNPAVIPGRVSDTLRPDGVLPFQKTKEEAKAAFQKLIQKKPLLPKGFAENHRFEKITGVYVPFWLYDCGGELDGRYRATRVRVWRSGDYRYCKTSHYLLLRRATAAFSGIPMDASTKMDDALMESIEPFDYTQMVDFHTAYLSGFLADKFDVARECGKDRIRQRVSSSMDSLISHTFVGYDSVTPTNKNIHIDHSCGRYVLLPVWLLTIRFAEQTYHFAMNGQTGRITGNLPVSVGRAVAWFCGIALPLAALISVLLML